MAVLRLIGEVRPIQMTILQAAKANDDAKALEIVKTIAAPITRINEISNELVTHATSNTSKTLGVISR